MDSIYLSVDEITEVLDVKLFSPFFHQFRGGYGVVLKHTYI